MKRRSLKAILATLLLLVCSTLGAQTVKLYFPTDAYYANPYMGLVAWANEDPSNLEQDFSLVYVDVTWAEIEPERGVLDFATLEKRCQFSMWKRMGKRAVFRLVLDKPGKKEHMDIPQWLYDMTGDGVFYDTSYGKGYCPNYENEILIAEHERLIKGLASWFWDDDFITFVQLGSVGHWGEWHIHSSVMDMPEISFLEVYLSHYAKAFVYDNVQLMMRRPFTFAANYGVGLFNDSLGIEKEDDRWLSWISDGGDYDNQSGGISPMPEAWKSYAIGGEISSNVDKKSLVKKGSEVFIDTLKASHTTWIGPNSLTELKVSGKSAKANLSEILCTIGYRLYVSCLVMDDLPDGRTQVEITLSNAGIAPFYFPWVVRLRAKALGESIVTESDVDVTSVLPGEDVKFSVVFAGPVSGLEIGVFNPNDNEEGLFLVMESPRDGYWQRLI